MRVLCFALATLAWLAASDRAVRAEAISAPCALAGFAWDFDPRQLEGFAPNDPNRPRRRGDEVCEFAAAREVAVSGESYRFLFGTIGRRVRGAFEDNGAGFVEVARREGERFVPLGRARLLSAEIIDGFAALEIRAIQTAGLVVVALTPRGARLLFVEGDRVREESVGAIVAEAARALPASLAAGQVVDVSLTPPRVRVALHAGGADDPARPGSAFEPPRALDVAFEVREGHVVAGESRVLEGAAAAGVATPSAGAWVANVRRQIGALPDGVDMCHLFARSGDPDPRGVNVREAPSPTARVLGRLRPPLRDRETGQRVPQDFVIVGYRAGWFLVDTDLHKEESSEPEFGPAGRGWFRGRGFVAARLVAGGAGNSGFGEHRLFAAPTPDATWIVGRERDGRVIDHRVTFRRVHACSLDWALVETAGGQRGWRRHLCGGPPGSCS